MNACLADLAARTIDGLVAGLRELRVGAPLYLTQNDGTLMAADVARRYPVHTFSSGPTNSMRVAAFLSGLRDAIVVDVGGTTTDVGAIVRSLPREAGVAVHVGGVRTNFRMPDVLSIGLGGGSLVDGGAVGPRSVGYRLARDARVFGGETLTASDVAVAAGRARMGDPGRVRELDRGLVTRAMTRIDAMANEAIDRVRTSADPVPVVAVGGGSVLLPAAMPVASRIVRPEHYEVANAVGAAIAEVSGKVDRVFMLAEGREAILARATAEATERAVDAGADRDRIEIAEVDEVPLASLRVIGPRAFGYDMDFVALG
jgi:N-methylhydantoinase A/oxoprolinase/acetone carboxylase beta subunit